MADSASVTTSPVSGKFFKDNLVPTSAVPGKRRSAKEKLGMFQKSAQFF